MIKINKYGWQFITIIVQFIPLVSNSPLWDKYM